MKTPTTLAQLESLERKGKLVFSHTSQKKGYVSRKSDGYVSEYKGRFGKGFIFYSPSFISTRYHYVSYFLIP